MKSKKWSNNSILKKIKNPAKEGYEIKIKNPEITFEGDSQKPDFAVAYITMYPSDWVIELKSLKEYFFQFRSQRFSYERLINVVYDDLKEIYDPERIRVVMEFNPRGGISSKLTIDSDWSVRGGKEEFKDWIVVEDKW